MDQQTTNSAVLVMGFFSIGAAAFILIGLLGGLLGGGKRDEK